MSNLKMAVILLGLILCQAQLVQAATVQLFQEWEERGFATNGFHLQTNAFYDDSAITGTGQERVLIHLKTNPFTAGTLKFIR